MIKTINYCNNCPECTHCGLNKDVKKLACDFCEDIYDEYYEIEGNTLCRSCAIEFLNDNVDGLFLNGYKMNDIEV